MSGESLQNRARRPMASVYVIDGTDGAWLVAETPDEIADMIRTLEPDDAGLIPLTIANPGESWNGRRMWARASRIAAVAPPLESEEDEA